MAVHASPSDAEKSAPVLRSDEDRSKDKFFHDVAVVADAMIAAHGREFAMGALVLAARFIAENKSFTKQEPAAECCGGHHNHEHHHHSKT